MTNIRAITGTMHNKVHEWLVFGDEWLDLEGDYLTVEKLAQESHFPHSQQSIPLTNQL